MIRRVLRAGLWVVLGLSVVGIVLFLLRHELAEDYLEQRLAGIGYPEARLQVTRLGWEGARIRDLALGEGGLKADRIDATYTPTDLFRGRVRRLELTGVELVVGRSAPRSLRRGLPLPTAPVREKGKESPRKERKGPVPLPELEVRDSRVRVRTARGEVPVELAARFQPGPGKGRLEARIAGEDGNGAATFALAVAAGEERDRGRVEFRGKADLAAPVWHALGLPSKTGGRLETAGVLRGDPPRSFPGLLDPDGVLESLTETGLTGTAGLELRDGHISGGAQGLEGHLGVTIRSDGPSLSVGLVEPFEVSARALGNMGLAPGGPSPLAGPFTITVADPESAPLLRVEPGERGVAVNGQGRIRWLGSEQARIQADLQGGLRLRPDWGVGGFSADPVILTGQQLDLAGIPVGSLAFQGSGSGTKKEASGQGTLQLQVVQMASPVGPWRDLALSAPVDWRWRTPGQVRLRLREPGGRVTARAPDGKAWRLEDPLRVALTEGRLERSPEGVISLSLRGQPEVLRTTLGLPDEAPLSAQVTPGPVQFQAQREAEGSISGELVLEETAATVPDWGIELAGLTAEARRGEETTLQLSLGRLRSTAEPPWLAPVTGKLVVLEEEAGEFTASGNLGPMGRSELLEIAGRFRPDSGDWSLSLDAPAVAFVPGDLQPEALSPRLSELRRVRGGISAEAELGPERERGQVRFLELSFESPSVQVEGLSGVTDLSRLIPPATPAGQRLSAQRIVAGVPLTEPELRFALTPGSGFWPTVRVEEARARLFGGRIQLADERLDLGAEAMAMTLRISELDLKVLLEGLGVADLSGRGQLSGEVPVQVSDDGIAVDTGRLEAEGEGRLRYRSEAAKRALGGAGEQVRLMLRALEDFRYEELALTINQPPEEGLELKVTTLGHNPDVLDGHPFRINLNLTGDLAPLIRALARGRELSADLLERALDLQSP